jgi:hypothetical protein
MRSTVAYLVVAEAIPELGVVELPDGSLLQFTRQVIRLEKRNLGTDNKNAEHLASMYGGSNIKLPFDVTCTNVRRGFLFAWSSICVWGQTDLVALAREFYDAAALPVNCDKKIC